ncbi:phytase [Undibacterium sp. Di24W]|uniref:phytase n=1 Tax=Undibacterium sp. Di24W TaxID=3413033 RepID=UPI003BF397FE
MQNQNRIKSKCWRGLGIIALTFLSAGMVLPASSAQTIKPTPNAIKALPNFIQTSLDFRALRSGDWLVLDKKALRLLTADGLERASYKVRAKHFDLRENDNHALAVLIDSDTQHALPIQVQDGKLRLAMEMPAPSSSLESSCLFRDAQQLTHLFVIAKDGHAQQWLLDAAKPRLVRNMALPANVKFCEVDDQTETLYINEEHFGLWAYSAQSESSVARRAVLLRQPYGRLLSGAHTIQGISGGIAVLDEAGTSISVLRAAQQEWKLAENLSKKNYATWPQHAGLLRSHETAKTITFYLRDDDKKSWFALNAKSLAKNSSSKQKDEVIPVLIPQAQTEEMSRLGDAADDPAIWRHPKDSKLSRVLGTNKKQGLLVYDLEGKQTQLLEVGRLNNVDVRQNIQWQDSNSDVAISTQRDDNSLVVFDIDANGMVKETSRIATGMEKIYGTCLYQPNRGGLEAFVNDKDGLVQHWRIERKNGTYVGTQLRHFKIATQPEGCVVDDKNARLFIGEEKRGVWLANADAATNTSDNKPLQLIAKVDQHLHADVEGLALYHGKQASYLLVSSQGDSSYVIYDAQAPFAYRGKFRIGFNTSRGIDGSSETDGIEVSSANFGAPYEDGIFIVQDGHKHLPDGAQNFKYIDWKQIARALRLTY